MEPFDLRQWTGFQQAGGNSSNPAIVDQIAIDSRRIDSEHALFVALKGDQQDGHEYVQQAALSGAKYALVFEGWQSSIQLKDIILLRVRDPLRSFQEIAKAYRLTLPAKIIGITGSFGKTMLKDLLYAFLSTEINCTASPESFNSQIGVPLSLLKIRKEHKFAIIEAAISHKNEMDVLADLIQPQYTILTPIGKKHLATLDDLSVSSKEMMKLVLSTQPFGWTLIPNEFLLHPFLAHLPVPYYFWNKENARLPHASTIHSKLVMPAPYQINFPDQSSFYGTIHYGYTYFLNLINMSLKAAWLLHISSEHIKEVLANYQLEPMRTEIWKSPLGSTFINDTYCSDPQSIDQSLRHFHYATGEQKKIFIFGGMKGSSSHQENDYRRIGKVLNKTAIHKLVLYGNCPFNPLIDEISKKS